MNSNAPTLAKPAPSLTDALLFPACAGAMGWGIRGQYGHETGAMIAGLLISLALVLLLVPAGSAPRAVRAVALGTVAIGFGGSMTYGQTIGLTQDPALIGNWAALRWGMLGLAIKGAVWAGFCGLFLGMGLGGKPYGAARMLGIMLGLIALYGVGTALIHQPFDPAARRLPAVYFSADWRWQPEAELRPRREVWGGLWLGWLALLAACRWWFRDRLAFRLGLWGALAGAIGFPCGQCLQAYHAWNRELIQAGLWAEWAPRINWWNMMETTFGAWIGAGLGLGLWLNRPLIQVTPAAPAAAASTAAPGLRPAAEIILMAIHCGLLIAVEFFSVPVVDWIYDIGVVMGLIPMVGIAAGRWWPICLALPITLLPIAGKTVRQLAYREPALAPELGGLIYFALPLALAVGLALWLQRRIEPHIGAHRFARPALGFATLLYFSLNFAFFRFPWPWEPWTGRTPNAMIFALCAAALLLLALRRPGADGDAESSPSAPDSGIPK